MEPRVCLAWKDRRDQLEQMDHLDHRGQWDQTDHLETEEALAYPVPLGPLGLEERKGPRENAVMPDHPARKAPLDRLACRDHLGPSDNEESEGRRVHLVALDPLASEVGPETRDPLDPPV